MSAWTGATSASIASRAALRTTRTRRSSTRRRPTARSCPPLAEDDAYASGQAPRFPRSSKRRPSQTEVVLTNVSATPQTVRLSYVADAVQAPDSRAAVSIPLAAGEQKVIPAFVPVPQGPGRRRRRRARAHVRGSPAYSSPPNRRAGSSSAGGRRRRAAAAATASSTPRCRTARRRHPEHLGLRPPAERPEPHESRARQHGRIRCEHDRPPRRPLRRRDGSDREVLRRFAPHREVDPVQRRPRGRRNRGRLRARPPDVGHEPVPGLRRRRGRRAAAGAERRRGVRRLPGGGAAPSPPSSSRSGWSRPRAGRSAPRAFAAWTTSAPWPTTWRRCLTTPSPEWTSPPSRRPGSSRTDGSIS